MKRININSLVDPTFSVRSSIAKSDILQGYLGLLCLGKRQCLWATSVQLRYGDVVLAARRVYRLTECTIDKKGQQMLLPEYVREGWSTTMPEAFTSEQIMVLYADHGTHDQCHSEFKTDMEHGRARAPVGAGSGGQ